MATKKSEPKTSVEMIGAVDAKGTVTGKGTLTFSLRDAAKAGITIERKSDVTIVKLSTTVGWKVRTGKELVLSGALAKSLKDGKLEGDAGITLKVSKNVDVAVSHKFQSGADTTGVAVTIRF